MFSMASTPHITSEQIKIFHKRDRYFFTLLTIILLRDPHESMQVMALWFWLEQTGLHDAINTFSTLPHFLIHEIADEAVSCIKVLMRTNPFALSLVQIKLPRTQMVLGTDFSSKFLPENRGVAINGIKEAFSKMCLKALTDLLEHAIRRNAARAMVETQVAMPSFMDPSFASLNISNSSSRTGSRVNSSVSSPPVAVEEDDRTMFATFSKGLPVIEPHIREFLNTRYGDCIEVIRMPDVPAGEQPLYTLIVFYSPDMIETVLNGEEKAKFTIRGRHVWMRKYVPMHRI